VFNSSHLPDSTLYQVEYSLRDYIARLVDARRSASKKTVNRSSDRELLHRDKQAEFMLSALTIFRRELEMQIEIDARHAKNMFQVQICIGGLIRTENIQNMVVRSRKMICQSVFLSCLQENSKHYSMRFDIESGVRAKFWMVYSQSRMVVWSAYRFCLRQMRETTC
jgi:hypothetical protein